MANQTNSPITSAQLPSPKEGEWLLVVDMQRAFSVRESPWFVKGFSDVSARLKPLLPQYGSRVIMTRYVPPSPAERAWRSYMDAYPSMDTPEGDPLWDIVVDYPADALIETRTGFAKWDEKIASLVGDGAPIAVCGVATECCVLGTVMHAIESGREIKLLSNLCAGASDELHESTLMILRSLGPIVTVI